MSSYLLIARSKQKKLLKLFFQNFDFATGISCSPIAMYKSSLVQFYCGTHAHMHTHTHAHTRTHAHTHTVHTYL